MAVLIKISLSGRLGAPEVGVGKDNGNYKGKNHKNSVVWLSESQRKQGLNARLSNVPCYNVYLCATAL